MATVQHGRDQQDLAVVLKSAVDLARAQRVQFEAYLEQVRQAHREHSQRLRDVEKHLRKTTEHLEQLQLVQGQRPMTEYTLELAGSREQLQALRQQQAWLAEKLVRLTGAGRKLQVAIRQAQMTASYLEGDASGPDSEDDQLTSLAQLRALQAQEEERLRLAREIHDGPAQVLANAVFELEYCQRLLDKDPKRLEAELARLKDDLKEGLAEVRQFIFDLRPGPLSELGLAATIRSYAENYQSRFGIGVSLDVDDNLGRLPPSQEIGIFRILQEALQNVRKHSGAAQVRIGVRRENGSISVAVEDDGRGFDVATVETSARHFGLVNMQERARLMRGVVQIVSQSGTGTRVMLDVPINQGADI